MVRNRRFGLEVSESEDKKNKQYITFVNFSSFFLKTDVRLGEKRHIVTGGGGKKNRKKLTSFMNVP